MNYCFANKVFEIETAFPYFHNFAKNYVSDKSAEYKITITKEDVQEWKNTHDDCDGFSLEYIETLVIHAEIARLLSKENIFILHGSTIGFESLDNCYAFVAPSGTGKSTHVQILRKVFKERVITINDDKPFLQLNDGFKAYGSPWDGKEHLSNNVSGNLKGIFVIKRSKENKVTKIKPVEAINSLVRQLYLPKGKDESSSALNALVSLSSNVPVYCLEVNMEDEAALTSAKVMIK